MEKKTLKINWNKPGGTASKNAKPTAKVSLPSTWMQEMGITEDDREVSVSFNGKTITINRDLY